MTLRARLDPAVLTATDEPSVWTCASSRGGAHYTIVDVGTPFPRHVGRPCPGDKSAGACDHITQALQIAVRLHSEETQVTQSDTSKAMVRATEKAALSPAVVRNEEVRLQAASSLQAWTDLLSLGKQMITTGFAPTDVNTPEKAALILLKAMEMGIPATAAFEFIAVIKGRPKLMGQMIQALVNRSGKGRIVITESSSTRAVAVGHREGWNETVTCIFTIEDAKNANLNSDVWRAYPADMLVWKATARVGRRQFADVLSGMDVMDAQGGTLDSEDVNVPEGHESGTLRVDVIDGEYSEVSTESERAAAFTAATTAADALREDPAEFARGFSEKPPVQHEVPPAPAAAPRASHGTDFTRFWQATREMGIGPGGEATRDLIFRAAGGSVMLLDDAQLTDLLGRIARIGGTSDFRDWNPERLRTLMDEVAGSLRGD